MNTVSFVVPAYNAESFIDDTLRSLRAQRFAPVEILVVDDGSTDSTPERVQRHAAEDSRVQLLHQANSGVAAARNHGISNARGTLVAPVDADDIWHPEAARRLVECLEGVGVRCGLAYCWSAYVDQRGYPKGGYRASTIAGDVSPTLLCHNFIGNASATLIRRSTLDQVGLYDPEFHRQEITGCEDWDLYLRIASRYAFAVVPRFLVGYRKPRESMSAQYDRMWRSQSLVIERWYADRPQASAWWGRLSRGSFALYLAQEAQRRGDTAAVRQWSDQAWQQAAAMALFRPAWWNCRFVRRGPKHGDSVPEVPESVVRSPSPERQLLELPWWRRPRLQANLLVQQAAHRLLRALAGRAERGRPTGQRLR